MRLGLNLEVLSSRLQLIGPKLRIFSFSFKALPLQLQKVQWIIHVLVRRQE
jgi:hypothetical protein